MNRRYIDFVPVNRRQASAKERDMQPEKDEFEAVPINGYETVYQETTIYEEPIDDGFDDFGPSPDEFDSSIEDNSALDEDSDLADDEPAVKVSIVRKSAPKEYDSDSLSRELAVEDILVAKETPEVEGAKTFEPRSDFGFGLVEDYVPVDKKRPAFIDSAKQVEKRPLSTPAKVYAHPSQTELADELAAAKSAKVTKRPLDFDKKGTAKEDAGAAASESASKAEAEFKKPKFINTHLIEKRPLSKTNYRDRSIVAVEESTTSPITIIDKPEKDSRLGFIVTILLTIILGAAVGVVAFLLIPK